MLDRQKRFTRLGVARLVNYWDSLSAGWPTHPDTGQEGKNNKNRIKSNKKYVHTASKAGDVLACEPNDDVR